MPSELALLLPLLPLLLVLERLLRRRRLLVRLPPDVVEELLVPGVAEARTPLEATAIRAVGEGASLAIVISSRRRSERTSMKEGNGFCRFRKAVM